MPALYDHLAAALARIDQRHERRATVACQPQGAGVLERGGARLLDFSSNDYLGLARHPLLMRRAADWALEHGAGSAASRLVTGTRPQHLAVEAKVAAILRPM
jgi:8-amino-7-oxononanoate synthase